MAQPADFQSQHNAVEGLDQAARDFFELERKKHAPKEEAKVEADPEPDPEKPATPEEPLLGDRVSRAAGEDIKPDPEQADPEEKPEDPPAEEPADESSDQEPEVEEISLDTMVEMSDGANVSIHELQRGFMREQDYTAKTTELSAQRKEFEAKVGEAYQVYEKRIGDANELAVQLQAALQTYQPNPQMMEKLRVQDPGEYSARMEDMRIKQGLVDRALQGQKDVGAEAARRADETRAARVPIERKLLAERLPIFKKDFDGEYERLSRYAVASDGGELRPEEWDLVDDHRYVTLVWKAREYDRATRTTAPEVRKKIARKPRRLRSGSQSEAGDTGDVAVKAAMANLKANPDSKAAAQQVFFAREQRRRAKQGARGGRT